MSHGFLTGFAEPGSGEYLGELAEVVQSTQGVELLQRQHQSLMRRRVHEVEVNQVIYTCQRMDEKTECRDTATGVILQSGGARGSQKYLRTDLPLKGAPACCTRCVFFIPRLLSNSTTLPRLVLWISGTVVSSISCLNAQAV